MDDQDRVTGCPPNCPRCYEEAYAARPVMVPCVICKSESYEACAPDCDIDE
jgi:hypothetical protein